MANENGSYCATLHNGVLMPIIGLGTYGLHEETLTEAFRTAVESGYRHFDTAYYYNNEKDIGKILHKCRAWSEISGKAQPVGSVGNLIGAKWVADTQLDENRWQIPCPTKSDAKRTFDPIFVTTKVWPTDFGYDKVRSSVNRSLERLKMDRVDLVLLHWPSDPEKGIKNEDENAMRHESWRALEDLLFEGKIRAAGVSNYAAKHLSDLIQFVEKRKTAGVATAVIPMVNQIEVSPLCQPPDDLVNLCTLNKVRIVSYSTLGSGNKAVLNNKVVKILADRYNKPAANICLRWCLQTGISVIPKSTHSERIASNFDVFDFSLTEDEMAEIKKEDKQIRYCPDPNVLP